MDRRPAGLLEGAGPVGVEGSNLTASPIPRPMKVQAPAKKRTKGHLQGFPCTPMVYFVQARTLGFIKIGVTVDIGSRINSIQVGCPDHVDLIGGIADRRAYHLELALHARFADDRHRGEWFRPSEALLAFIARWPMSRVEEKRNFDVLLALGGQRPKRRAPV